ncbi:MFS transporter [Nocardia seriolae]|nr:MFS transporter [Nocardia seriolae]
MAPAPASRWAMLAVLCASLLLVAMDATILNVALPSLIDSMEPSPMEQLWIVDLYGLVLGGLLITCGAISDRYGRKRLFLGGFLLFGLASVVAATATAPAQLIAGRALLGVGGAMVMPSTLSLIRNIFTDDKERTLAIGIWASVAGGRGHRPAGRRPTGRGVRVVGRLLAERAGGDRHRGRRAVAAAGIPCAATRQPGLDQRAGVGARHRGAGVGHQACGQGRSGPDRSGDHARGLRAAGPVRLPPAEVAGSAAGCAAVQEPRLHRRRPGHPAGHARHRRGAVPDLVVAAVHPQLHALAGGCAHAARGHRHPARFPRHALAHAARRRALPDGLRPGRAGGRFRGAGRDPDHRLPAGRAHSGLPGHRRRRRHHHRRRGPGGRSPARTRGPGGCGRGDQLRARHRPGRGAAGQHPRPPVHRAHDRIAFAGRGSGRRRGLGGWRGLCRRQDRRPHRRSGAEHRPARLRLRADHHLLDLDRHGGHGRGAHGDPGSARLQGHRRALSPFEHVEPGYASETLSCASPDRIRAFTAGSPIPSRSATCA